jgi:hypothetical protein
MLEYAKALIPHILTIVVTVLMYFLGRRKSKAEIDKIESETRNFNKEGDIKLIEFYKEQLSSLLVRVKEQVIALDDKERDRLLCEEKLHDLEVRFNALSTKFTLLEKKLS